MTRDAPWHNDLDVGAPFSIRNTVFPEVVTGDNDRASFFFLGTPSAGDGTGADTGTPFNGVWARLHSHYLQRGQDLVHCGCHAQRSRAARGDLYPGATCPSGTRNLLDFNDLTVDKAGRVFAAYTMAALPPLASPAAITPPPATRVSITIRPPRPLHSPIHRAESVQGPERNALAAMTRNVDVARLRKRATCSHPM